jgi:hypothetical protein
LTVNNQPFLFTIENITRTESDSYLEDHSTINVKVYDINYKILAENFTYIPNKEWVDSKTVIKLLNDVVKEMQDNAKDLHTHFYWAEDLFLKLNSHVTNGKRDKFQLLQNCQNCGESSAEVPIYYASKDGDLVFTIQNVKSYGNKLCDIQVKIYDPFDLDEVLQERTFEISS